MLPNLAEEESAEKATSLMTVSYCFSNSSIRSFKAYRTKKRDDKIRMQVKLGSGVVSVKVWVRVRVRARGILV